MKILPEPIKNLIFRASLFTNIALTFLILKGKAQEIATAENRKYCRFELTTTVVTIDGWFDYYLDSTHHSLRSPSEQIDCSSIYPLEFLP